MKIEIYSTTNCPYCVSAKKLLQDRNLAFQEIDVSEPEKKEALKNKTGWRTVPQIFIDDQLIGGFQELAAMDKKGLLKD